MKKTILGKITKFLSGPRNEHFVFTTSALYCALAIILVNGLKFMLLANLLPHGEVASTAAVLVKNLMNLLDIAALDFILRKRWIEASNKLNKIYAVAFTWTLVTAALANGLDIISSDSGEEIEIQRFLNCFSEFFKLVIDFSRTVFDSFLSWITSPSALSS